MVDDELCGDLEPSVDGEPHVVLQETCTVPCPGKRSKEEERGGRRRRRRNSAQNFKNGPGG